MIDYYTIDYISTDMYIPFIFLAIIFFVITRMNSKTSMAALITVIIAIAMYFWRYYADKGYIREDDKKILTLDEDISNRKETNESLFMLRKFPKKMKYLKENNDFVAMVHNIRFVQKFNKSRYADILLNMNLLMKIYIYILAERYEPELHICQYIDTRDNIIDLLYSLIIIVPDGMRHVYSLDTHQEIHNTIDEFVYKSREMLTTLEKFAKIHKKSICLPETIVKPFNEIKKFNFP